jgi:cleavage and polyadenylation specificity factor subunit 3
MAAKRKLAAMAPDDDDPVDPADELMFLCLGGGNEVGRSCHIIQYKGKTVMVRLPSLARNCRVLMVIA